MRRYLTVLVTAAVTLSLATIGVMSIASAAPNNQLDSTTAQTLTVLAHATDFEMINVNGKEIGPGDYLVERWALRRSGAPVGRLNDQCTINFDQTPSNPTALCLFAFTFGGEGEITGDGSVVFAPAPEGFRPFPSTCRSPAAREATRAPAARSTSNSWTRPTPASPSA
jgi:hypothetical protein